MLFDEVDNRRRLSGVNRENAEKLQMFSNNAFSMGLSLWNDREIDGTWKLKGDITLSTKNTNSSIWGGVCLGFPDESQSTRYDCMIFKVILDLEDLDGPELPDVVVMDDDVYPPKEVECSKVTIYDGYQTNGPSIDSTSLRIDDTVDTIDDPSINWMKVDERISKDCEISHRDATKVTCESLNIGFERNFRTDNYMQDFQLSASMAG